MLNTQYCIVFIAQFSTHTTVQCLQSNAEHTVLYSVYSPMLNTPYCTVFTVQFWTHTSVQCLQSNAEHTVLCSSNSTILNTHNCTELPVQCWTHRTVQCLQINAEHTVLYSKAHVRLTASRIWQTGRECNASKERPSRPIGNHVGYSLKYYTLCLN